VDGVELGVALEQAREAILHEPADSSLRAAGAGCRKDVEGHRDVAKGGKPNQEEPHAYQL
jgi:hypothetical protein